MSWPFRTRLEPSTLRPLLDPPQLETLRQYASAVMPWLQRTELRQVLLGGASLAEPWQWPGL